MTAGEPIGRLSVELDWREGRPVVYACCIEYEGAHAVFSTLERAIEVGGPYCNFIVEFVLDPVDELFSERRAVWSNPRYIQIKDEIAQFRRPDG